MNMLWLEIKVRFALILEMFAPPSTDFHIGSLMQSEGYSEEEIEMYLADPSFDPEK